MLKFCAQASVLSSTPHTVGLELHVIHRVIVARANGHTCIPSNKQTMLSIGCSVFILFVMTVAFSSLYSIVPIMYD